MARKILIILLFGGGWFAGWTPVAFAGSLYPDIEILRQDAYGVEFVYRPGGVKWLSLGDSLNDYVLPVVAQTTYREIPREPRLPVRLVFFGLPSAGEFDWSVTDERWASAPGVRVQVYSDLSVQPQEKGARPTKGGNQATLTGTFPEQRIQRLPTGRLRSQQIGGLAIYPVICYPAEMRADVLESITVRVEFRGGEPATVSVSEGAFDRVLSIILLNDESSRSFRRKPFVSPGLARPTADPFAAAVVWHKLRTGSEGICRLTYAVAESLGLRPADVANPRQIRVFYGGGKMLPLPGFDTLPPLREVALHTWGFEDSTWGPGDYLEFYAQGLHRWEINPATGKFTNVFHSFESANVYWLTPSATLSDPPHRVGEADAAPVDPLAMQVFSVQDWATHERNLVLRERGDGYVGDYYTWYWQRAQHIPISLYNAVDVVPGNPATLQMRTYSFGNPVRLSVNGSVLAPFFTSRDNDTNLFRLDAYSAGTGVQIDFTDSVPSATYLDGYDLQYERQLRLRGGKLRFAAPETTATAVFTVSDVGAADPVVWDVTDPFAPVVLTGVARDGGVVRFQAHLSSETRSIFRVADGGVVSRPLSAEQRRPAPLRQTSNRADLLAVGPRLFIEAADEYLRRQENITGLAPEKVAIEDIYDNFSHGLVDPLAIRWFLKFAFENWQRPAPQYVLLVGDGHFDLADNMKTGAASYVPPYLAPDEPLPSDENFIYFGPEKVLMSSSGAVGDPYPDMIIGRWPVKNTEQVRTMAQKIERYQSAATLGPWRNRVALVADDEATGNCVYDPGNEIHTIGAELLSTSSIPVGFEQRKVYLTEYPFGPTCRSKPGAHDAILDLINDGVLLIDYIGHGNADLWAHEHVLERAVDVPKMQNTDRLMVMFTASCSNGFFDDPIGEGLAEEVVRWPDGGAVAAISATRLVFADANLSLNELVFELMFSEQRYLLGEALYIAKVLRQFEEDHSCLDPPCERPNDRKFVLFGDPTMNFGAPRHRIAFDEITPDTLAALGVVTVRGRITDEHGTTLSDFNGTGDFSAADAFRERRYQASPNVRIDYNLPGRTMFKGQTPITAGEFSFGFVVPKDITYGGRTAKIIGYAQANDADAAGGIGNLRLAGTAPGIADSTGPLIALQVGNQPLSEGMVLTPGSEVSVALEDTSGINLTSEPGHAITVMYDDDPATGADITPTFSYQPGDFRRGRAHFTLGPDRPAGPLAITVKAWDNANNSAQTRSTVAVGTAEDFHVLEFLNYPNPFNAQTTFYFRTSGVPTRASIQVFTLAGRLIRTIDGAADGSSRWDGTDELGQKVANGVYITKLKVAGRVVEAAAAGADKTAERIQKVVLWR